MDAALQDDRGALPDEAASQWVIFLAKPQAKLLRRKTLQKPWSPTQALIYKQSTLAVNHTSSLVSRSALLTATRTNPAPMNEYLHSLQRHNVSSLVGGELIGEKPQSMLAVLSACRSFPCQGRWSAPTSSEAYRGFRAVVYTS